MEGEGIIERERGKRNRLAWDIRMMSGEDAAEGAALLQKCFQELDPGGRLFAADAPERLIELYGRIEGSAGLALTARTVVDETHRKNASSYGSNNILALLMFRLERRPLRKISEAVQIDAAYVQPEMRKKGIMRSMLQQMNDWACDRGIHVVELGTPTDMLRSVDFWKHQGFASIFTTLRSEV